jgi:pyruvate dehydrogenase E2 component (dihydrolipoamide acetyltransferase)
MVKNQCQPNFKMSTQEIKVPNIGDFEQVEVIEVLVENGQTISKNDPLITIESDKSSVEIPSSADGTITSVKIKVGDKVSEGDLICVLESKLDTVQEKEKKKIIEETKKPEVTKKEPMNTVTSDNYGVISASPKVRKFARELGADIYNITGTQNRGRIIEDDVKNFIANKIVSKPESKPSKIKNEFEHSDFGEVEVKNVPRVKKLASTYLVNSWTTIPHVTNHDEADITEMENFRSSLTDIYTGEKMKITPLAFIISALVSSLKKFPSFNSSIYDNENGNMTLKK